MKRADRKGYPSDVSDEEWSFAAPYLTLMDVSAPQRKYELRDMFDALRWMARAGAPRRMLPNDFPPWELVYQQTQRWLQAGSRDVLLSVDGKGASRDSVCVERVWRSVRYEAVYLEAYDSAATPAAQSAII